MKWKFKTLKWETLNVERVCKIRDISIGAKWSYAFFFPSICLDFCFFQLIGWTPFCPQSPKFFFKPLFLTIKILAKLRSSAIFLSRDRLFFLILSSSCTRAKANEGYFINNRMWSGIEQFCQERKISIGLYRKRMWLDIKTKNNNLSKLNILPRITF